MVEGGSETKGFAGTLKNFHLSDIIQMCCLSMASLTIHVFHDNKFGLITIDNGQIVHSQCEDRTGVDAFYRIMSWGGGNFEALDLVPYSERTIHQNSQFLLMEAARALDEVSQKGRDHRKDVEHIHKTKFRVLIVDDSPIMGKILTSVFVAQGDIDVVGVASNGEQALKMIDRLHPELIALDINMPVMDGNTALKHIMIKKPCPVVIMSNIGDCGHMKVMDFLNLGAVDFMSKPVRSKNIVLQQQKIVERLRTAKDANLNSFRRVRLVPNKNQSMLCKYPSPCEFCVIINSGAGGYADLMSLLVGLSPVPQIGIVSLQTIPPSFVLPFSEYIGQFINHKAMPMKDGMSLFKEQCILGTNGVPLRLEKNDGRYLLKSTELSDPLREEPHFTQFLESLLYTFSGRVAVVFLSGAESVDESTLNKVKQKGWKIFAHDKRHCMISSTFSSIFDSLLLDFEGELKGIVDSIVKFEKEN